MTESATKSKTAPSKSADSKSDPATADISPGTIPAEGIAKDELLDTMRGFREGDADWKAGRTWSLVYYAGEEHYDLLKSAYELFFSENGLNPMAFKSLKRMEAEVVRMTATMLNGDEDVVGTMTSGGTESILMAVKAARERASWLKKWPLRPEIVAPQTIHPAFAKAAHYFGAKMRYVPVGDDFRVDVDALEKAVGPRTMLIAASAPQYPHGMVDPIPEISEIALERGVPFHVDACFGGFILPWIEKLGYDLPVFDFRLPGVTSMSADCHKYGYAAKGASTVLYRDMSYLRHQFFVDTEFPGGIYASPTMAGTRPGGGIAAAWAAMKSLGEDGYMELAKAAMDAAHRLKADVRAIDGLKILGSEHATIVTFAAADDDVDIYAVADQMQDKGWALDRQHKPASLHCTVNGHNAPVIDDFIADLTAAVDHVRQHPELASEGDAAMYGMMAKIPVSSAVKMSVRKVMEEMYGKNAAEPDIGNIGGGDDADIMLKLIDEYGDQLMDVLERFEGLKDWFTKWR
ncbi:MAG: pyridoxal phosphate-dependent decarboxylase family protein [Persicimonas sp.]